MEVFRFILFFFFYFFTFTYLFIFPSYPPFLRHFFLDTSPLSFSTSPCFSFSSFLGKVYENSRAGENSQLRLGFSLICPRILSDVRLGFYQAMKARWTFFLFFKWFFFTWTFSFPLFLTAMKTLPTVIFSTNKQQIIRNVIKPPDTTVILIPSHRLRESETNHAFVKLSWYLKKPQRR